VPAHAYARTARALCVARVGSKQRMWRLRLLAVVLLGLAWAAAPAAGPGSACRGCVRCYWPDARGGGAAAVCGPYVLLSNTTGVITNLPGNYANSQTCAFSIRSDNSSVALANLGAPVFITLRFTSFSVECMCVLPLTSSVRSHTPPDAGVGGPHRWDYVRVYENGINGTLLGAFTGDALPPMLYTAQRELLVVLRSDFTTTFPGFSATYTIALCPNNCGGVGTCVNGVCQCSSPFKGAGCEQPICPNACNINGLCSTTSDIGCRCNAGFKGGAPLPQPLSTA
jgi:hypothetical protein